MVGRSIHRRIVRWRAWTSAEPIPPMQQFGAQAVRDTLGRSTDVDACVALASRLDQLLTQAAQHLQPAGRRPRLSGRAAISAATCG